MHSNGADCCTTAQAFIGPRFHRERTSHAASRSIALRLLNSLAHHLEIRLPRSA
jgi:hypothetical protein